MFYSFVCLFVCAWVGYTLPDTLPPFPSFPPSLTAQEDAAGSKCVVALSTAECADDIECKTALEVCDETCYMCYWQVKTWPVFQGECGKAGGGVRPPPEPPKKLRRRLFRRRLLLYPGLGSPPVTPQPENAASPAELNNVCWDTWDEFEKTPKARYLAGMVDQLGDIPWEANTVCKCLGICPFDEFEAVQLKSSCSWYEDDPIITGKRNIFVFCFVRYYYIESF